MNRRGFLRALSSAALAAYPGFALAERLPSTNDVVFLTPRDSDYQQYAVLFNKRIIRRPQIIAACFNESGVRQAVTQAGEQGLPVAIKSGGHSFEGFSLNDGGLSIDLTHMDAHRLTDDGRFVARPACRLMQVYEYLVPRGRIIPAGSCGMVGIAGLTLGGGYGLFSRQHGLTCDALRSIRLVDAKGDIHVAKEGSELMWACRGGGNGHFGVVTELEFATVPAPSKIWRYLFKTKNASAEKLGELLRIWFDLAPELSNEAFSAFVLDKNGLRVLITSTSEAPDARLAQVLKRLQAVMDKRYPDRQEDLLSGIRRYYGKLAPLYFKNASAGYYRQYEDIKLAARQVLDIVINTPELVFQINTLGGAIATAGSDASACYAHRKYPFLGEIQSYWEDPRQEQRATLAVGNVQALLKGCGVNAHYCNYPDKGFENWHAAYYGSENYARLRAMKKQYDPQNLFRYEHGVRA